MSIKYVYNQLVNDWNYLPVRRSVRRLFGNGDTQASNFATDFRFSQVLAQERRSMTFVDLCSARVNQRVDGTEM